MNHTKCVCKALARANDQFAWCGERLQHRIGWELEFLEQHDFMRDTEGWD
jgi:hypothetical protein